jgi:hypothetical protein
MGRGREGEESDRYGIKTLRNPKREQGVPEEDAETVERWRIDERNP